MNTTEKPRYIGIIADGTTDQEIIAKFAKCLLKNTVSCKDVILGQSLEVDMQTFRRKSSELNNYGLYDRPAIELKNRIIMILNAAVGEFQSLIPRELTDYDLLVLNTDAEWYLREQNQYFDKYAMVISKIFLIAIEEFYHLKAKYGYQWGQLPLIIPLVFFPSTDILIAALKIGDTLPFDFHGLRANEIKMRLYGVEDLRHLRDEELKEKALDFITPDAFKAVYRHIPESRIFLRTLLWNQVLP